MPAPHRHPLALLLAAGLAAGATAQTPNGPIDFKTPDGCRFLLLPEGTSPVVHWAVATPAGPREDPPGLEGLAEACAQASLSGTWSTGSLDPAAERRALAALDDAATALASAPRVEGRPPAELVQRYEAAERAAAALSDLAAFRRVLATTPATDVTLQRRDAAMVLSWTTTLAALPQVANLLVERREQQPLREIVPLWNDLRRQQLAAWDASAMAPLRAEVLALAFAGSPLARAADRPAGGVLARAQAEACWQRTQRPERTVHVLIGGFVAADVRKQLERIFATTALPVPDLPKEPPAGRLTASRRSQLPGAPFPIAAIAWQLTGNEDPVALAMAVSWFGNGADSWLGRELRRAGRDGVQVAIRAPWPTSGSPALVLVEVSEPGGKDHRLADQVLDLAAALVQKPPAVGQFQPAAIALLQEWDRDTQEARRLCERLAAGLLSQPTMRVPPAPPRPADARTVPALLTRILGSQPVVVTGKAR